MLLPFGTHYDVFSDTLFILFASCLYRLFVPQVRLFFPIFQFRLLIFIQIVTPFLLHFMKHYSKMACSQHKAVELMRLRIEKICFLLNTKEQENRCSIYHVESKLPVFNGKHYIFNSHIVGLTYIIVAPVKEKLPLILIHWTYPFDKTVPHPS